VADRLAHDAPVAEPGQRGEPLDRLVADAGKCRALVDRCPSVSRRTGPTTAGSHGSAAVTRSSTKVGARATSLLRTSRRGWVATSAPEFTAEPKPPFVVRRTTVTPSASGKGSGEQSSTTTISTVRSVAWASRSPIVARVGPGSP
jgi:hypothetical protein